MKVFGGAYCGRGRILIKAKTQKRAVELAVLHGRFLTLHTLRNYMSPTNNQEELDLTASFDEGVWYSETHYPKANYIKLEPKVKK